MKPRLAASSTLTSPVDPSREPTLYQHMELDDLEQASKTTEELERNHVQRGSIRYLKPTQLSPPPPRQVWKKLWSKTGFFLLLTIVIIIIVLIVVYLMSKH